MGRRHGLDPLLLWLWHRAAATALIRPLAWEHPYATSAALQKTKKKKKKKKTCTFRKEGILELVGGNYYLVLKASVFIGKITL